MSCKTETTFKLKCSNCDKKYNLDKWNGKDYYCSCGKIIVSKDGKTTLYRKEISTELKEKVNTFFDSVWKLYPKKSGKSSIKYTARKRLMDAGYETIVEAINEYKKDKDLKINGGYKIFMDGSTFFNTRWKDYVNDESSSVKVVDVFSHLEKKDLPNLTSSAPKKKLL